MALFLFNLNQFPSPSATSPPLNLRLNNENFVYLQWRWTRVRLSLRTSRISCCWTSSSPECFRQQTTPDFSNNESNVLPKNWWDVPLNLFPFVTRDSTLCNSIGITIHIVTRIICTFWVRETFHDANDAKVKQHNSFKFKSFKNNKFGSDDDEVLRNKQIHYHYVLIIETWLKSLAWRLKLKVFQINRKTWKIVVSSFILEWRRSFLIVYHVMKICTQLFTLRFLPSTRWERLLGFVGTRFFFDVYERNKSNVSGKFWHFFVIPVA